MSAFFSIYSWCWSDCYKSKKWYFYHYSYTWDYHRRRSILSEDCHSPCYDKCNPSAGTWCDFTFFLSLWYSYADPFFHADGTERQIIKDADGNMPRPKIRACSISDPFVLIIREDDSIGLFIGETERGKIRRKDMSPMGDKVRSLVSLPLWDCNLSASLRDTWLVVST